MKESKVTTFRSELILAETGDMVDYMEFETDSKEKAIEYSEKRFENAYPLLRKYNRTTISVTEL